MKNKIIITCATLLQLLFIFNVFIITFANDKRNDGNLYLIHGLREAKSCVVNNKSEIVYMQLYDTEQIKIYNDLVTKESALIEVYRTGESKDTIEYYSDEEGYFSYNKLSNRYLLFDKDGKELDIKGESFKVDIVCSNYAIDNVYDYQSNCYDPAKFFDITNNKFIENDAKLNVIDYKNNNLFGKKLVLENDEKKFKYYLLDNTLNIIREITEYEYEELDGKEFETKYIILDDYLSIGEKHGLKYILDKDNKKISIGYDCDLLRMANFHKYKSGIVDYNYDYNDILFCRIKDKKLTYFSLNGDIFTENITDDYSSTGYIEKYDSNGNELYKDNNIYGRKYSLDETFVPGENNCYAILDNVNNYAYIYNLRSNIQVATISSIIDNRNSDNIDKIYRNIYYLDDIYEYNGYIMCKYIDQISDTYVAFINYQSGNGFGTQILCKNEIGKLNNKYYIKKGIANSFQEVIEFETGNTIKTLYNNYIDMKVYKYEGKSIVALQKDYCVDNEYEEVFDLYDDRFNLLYANVSDLKKNMGLLSFVIKELKSEKELFKELNDRKIYNNKYVIIDFDNKKLFENKTNEGLNYRVSNCGIWEGLKRIFVEEEHYKEIDGEKKLEKIVLYDSIGKKVIDKDGILSFGGSGNYIFAYAKDKTYIYDENYKLRKTLHGKYKYSESKTYNTDKHLFKFENEDIGLYTLFDNEFNPIVSNCKEIMFSVTYSDLNILEEIYIGDYYYYINGFKIYVCNYEHDALATINYFTSIEDE